VSELTEGEPAQTDPATERQIFDRWRVGSNVPPGVAAQVEKLLDRGSLSAKSVGMFVQLATERYRKSARARGDARKPRHGLRQQRRALSLPSVPDPPTGAVCCLADGKTG
jgi:hypothetical protein